MTRRALLAGVVGLPLAGVHVASAAVIRLYLKDGSYQPVREYKVEGDRIRFYSTERGDWEEMPLELVDLRKTETEVKEREEIRKEDAKALAEEDKAEREAAREVFKVPQETGVYLVNGDSMKAIKEAEPKVFNNKGRHVLKLMSPIPLVTDKSWLEVDGLHSANVVPDARPEFYIRLNNEERFGIVKMGEHKGNRVVEKLTIMPVVKEVAEEPELVETFRRQIGDMLYKIWPEKPLAPGEYAVVEYTEGKVNMQVWDFGYPAPK